MPLGKVSLGKSKDRAETYLTCYQTLTPGPKLPAHEGVKGETKASLS